MDALAERTKDIVHIVVVSIDALQPAYLGAYGNEWIETPTFDGWAARGVVFDQHFADVSGTTLKGDAELFAQLSDAGLSARATAF